jgi:hypothetical protein
LPFCARENGIGLLIPSAALADVRHFNNRFRISSNSKISELNFRTD